MLRAAALLRQVCLLLLPLLLMLLHLLLLPRAWLMAGQHSLVGAWRRPCAAQLCHHRLQHSTANRRLQVG